MTTIQVPFIPSDLTEADVKSEVRAVLAQDGPLAERRELEPQAARVIASWWQSPGSVGHVLAGFASGSAVDRSDLLTDIHNTRPEAATRADRDALDCLSTFVINYA